MAVRRAIALLLTVVLAGCGGASNGAVPTNPGADPTGYPRQDPVAQSRTVPLGAATSTPAWLKCGVYAMPIPNDIAVQMIERGVVWVAYRPDLPEEQVQQLRDLVLGRKYLLLSPAPPDAPLSDPVVATAWELQRKVGSAGDPALAEFIDQHAKGSQTQEPGAPCADE